MRHARGAAPLWKRRPIFAWQLRVLAAILVGTLLVWTPYTARTATPYLLATHARATNATPPDPCLGRPSPSPLRASPRPTVFFLHVPKTAGTLLFKLVLHYAQRTAGLPCQYVYDGNRMQPHVFRQVGDAQFPAGSPERALQEALRSGDAAAKQRLFERGACRAVRGHVTYAQHDAIKTPVLSVTVVRDPLARFVSMYEFVKSMVRTRPGQTGWDPWLHGGSLAAEFANSSSLMHRGFYDVTGHWRAQGNVGFSFHFYGVLHQLSGLTPRFDGEMDPYHFNMSNARDMAERAMDNLCRTHVVGRQEDMPETLRQFFDKIAPWVAFSPAEKTKYAMLSINKTPGRLSRNVDDHLPERIRRELERRLEHEIRVYQFATKIVEYRKAIAAYHDAPDKR